MRTFNSKFARRGGRLTRSTKTFAGSDWREALNQRAREINAFRRAAVPLPNFEIGARVPRLYPGEPAPTVVRPEFLNSIHEEICAAIEANCSMKSWWMFGWLLRVRRAAVRWVRDLWSRAA